MGEDEEAPLQQTCRHETRESEFGEGNSRVDELLTGQLDEHDGEGEKLRYDACRRRTLALSRVCSASAGCAVMCSFLRAAPAARVCD